MLTLGLYFAGAAWIDIAPTERAKIAVIIVISFFIFNSLKNPWIGLFGREEDFVSGMIRTTIRLISVSNSCHNLFLCQFRPESIKSVKAKIKALW